MKFKECPICEGSYLGDIWQKGRKLQQVCHDCGWKGEIRTPEKKRINYTKSIRVGQFHGYHYEIFDKYGHTMVISRYYDSWDAADAAIKEEIEKGKTNKYAGPFTGILWPATVKVKGTRYK
jgi:hypothetical protein